MNKNSKKSKIIIAVSVVLVVAIIAVAIVLVLNKTSNPKGKNKDKKEEEIVFDKSTIVVANDKDLSFSEAEFKYFYYYIWQNIENTTHQYEYQYSQYYGAGAGVMLTGYDYTKSPAEQEYKDDYSSFTGITLSDLKVTSATWADVMKYAAITQLVQTKYGAKMARAEGLSLTSEEKANIDNQIKDLEDNAQELNFSTEDLLLKLYGDGITEKLVRSILTEQALADAYFKKYATDAENAITDQQILDVFNANPEKYKDEMSNIADVRHILIQFPDGNMTSAQKAETLAKAQEVLAKYNENPTEENFILLTKQFTDDVDSSGNPNNDGLYEGVTASSNYVEAFTNWAIDPARKPGDVGIIETEYGYHVMYYVKSRGEVWKETIKQELLSKASEDLVAKIDNEYINTIDMNSNLLTDAFESQTKHIEEKLIAMLGN